MPTLFAELPVCGIGSLPFAGPEPALNLVARHMPSLPHWPQLPRRGRQEYFTHQYLGPLIEWGLLSEREGNWSLFQDETRWMEGLVSFLEIYLAAADGDQDARQRFAPSRSAAEGLYSFIDNFGRYFPGARWVKGQIAGPLSVGLSLHDSEGRPVYYDPQLRELVIKCLAQGAAWQADALARFGLPVVIFVDDPALSAWGTSSHVGLDRNLIVSDLGEIATAIRQSGAVAGAHSCAAVDWSVLIDSGFEVLSFDAYGFFPSLLPYAAELEDYLGRGGLLAWGIVPTSGAAWEETPSSLARSWQEKVAILAGRGMDADLIRQQSLITPSCGTGFLEPDLAGHIYELAEATGRELLGTTAR